MVMIGPGSPDSSREPKKSIGHRITLVAVAAVATIIGAVAVVSATADTPDLPSPQGSVMFEV